MSVRLQKNYVTIIRGSELIPRNKKTYYGGQFD